MSKPAVGADDSSALFLCPSVALHFLMILGNQEEACRRRKLFTSPNEIVCLLICSQPVDIPHLSPIQLSAAMHKRFANGLETPSPLFVARSLAESNCKGAHRRRAHHNHRADQRVCCRRLRERCVGDSSAIRPFCQTLSFSSWRKTAQCEYIHSKRRRTGSSTATTAYSLAQMVIPVRAW